MRNEAGDATEEEEEEDVDVDVVETEVGTGIGTGTGTGIGIGTRTEIDHQPKRPGPNLTGLETPDNDESGLAAVAVAEGMVAHLDRRILQVANSLSATSCTREFGPTAYLKRASRGLVQMADCNNLS
jgi:hypothetical protein